LKSEVSMNIDFSPLQGTMNHMAMQLAIILVVPLVVGLIVKWLLLSFKIPFRIANFGAVLAFLFAFYKTVLVVL